MKPRHEKKTMGGKGGNPQEENFEKIVEKLATL